MQAMKKVLNKHKRKTVSVAMPPALIRQLDLYADKAVRSRSNIICELIREGLATREVSQ
jgi:metal-responsive CopG/Arc/MetJ family transcriptional regulator